MANYRAAAPEVATDVSAPVVLSVLLRGRRLLLAMVVLGALVGGGSALLMPRQYLSRATFLPKGSEEAVSGLALAASQFGVTLPNRGGDWWPSVYVELLNSRPMLEGMAADTFVVAELGNRRVTLVDLLEVPGATPAERVAQSVVVLRDIVAASEDKKLGGVKVMVRTPWPSVSFALVGRLVNAVNDFNISTRRTLAAAEREFVDAQVEDAERQLREAEDRLRRFQNANRSMMSPNVQFEREQLQRSVSMRTQMYTSLVQGLEQTRLRELRSTPVITLLESPRLPVLPEKRGAMVRALLGAVFGLFAGVVVMLVGWRGRGLLEAAKAAQADGPVIDAGTVARHWTGV